MPFTEQQIQMLAYYDNGIIRDMYINMCKKQIEEEERRRKEEIMSQMQLPSEEEIHDALQKLATYHLYRKPEFQDPPVLVLNPQPFYTKFINKKRKRRK